MFTPAGAAIFAAQIDPGNSDADEWLWVFASTDATLPTVYITADDVPTAKSAMQFYIRELSEWCEAILRDQQPKYFPATIAQTKGNARILKSKLSLIERELMSE